MRAVSGHLAAHMTEVLKRDHQVNSTCPIECIHRGRVGCFQAVELEVRRPGYSCATIASVTE